MDRRLNSPTSYIPGTGGGANSRIGSSINQGANIKKTIDILRERLSISPNRALETIQKINVANPNGGNQLASIKTGSNKVLKFTKERGSYIVENSSGGIQNNSVLSSALRTDRSQKRYGIGTTPPKNIDVSRNNSQKKNLNISLNQKSGANLARTKALGEKGAYGTGESRRSVDKSALSSGTKLSHNIYKPKTKTKISNPSDILKLVNLDRARAGSKNRSSTPNERDNIRSGLLTGTSDERSRGSDTLNLSSAGLKRPKLTSKVHVTPQKADSSFTYGEKRSLLTGVRK